MSSPSLSGIDVNSIQTIGLAQVEKNIHTLLARLRFISQVRPGELIDVNNHKFVQLGWITSITRTIKYYIGKEESREITLIFIQETMNEAINVIEKLFMSSNLQDRNIGISTLQELKNAKSSFATLEETYQDDRHFISRLQTFNIILDAKISTIETMIVQRFSIKE